MKIAHISDLHFAHLTLSPSQFFSKRWIGNFNLLLNRGRKFSILPLLELAHLFHELQVKVVIVSGDLSTTAQAKEFEAAAEFLETLRAAGMEILLIPGNHDNYTRQAYRTQFFYRTFDRLIERMRAPGIDVSLAHNRVMVSELGKGWWYVGIDSTLATPPFNAKGIFPPELEHTLEEVLRQIPPSGQIVMANHFPLLPTPLPRHNLERSEALRALLVQWPNVRLYLHGHIHQQSIRDLRPIGLPLILNSGSCGIKGNSTCHVIDLHSESCEVEVYHFHREPGVWDLRRKSTFDWSHH